jgi:4-amino-4-deoxy-L-arabinose transferase-like glycosyltransferase
VARGGEPLRRPLSSPRPFAALALAGLLALFAVVAAQGAWRPYLFDEANFLFQARAIAETGVPYANMGYMGDRGRVFSREQYGLWHPPLYLYLLGLNVGLFHADERAARGMGIAIMALTALAVYGLGHTAAGGGPRGRSCGLLASVLFLASPLVVQSATVIDIDGTLLLLATSCWTLLFLRWETAADWRRLSALGALLGLALWTKTTTPLALVGVVALYQALAGRARLGLRQAAVIVLVGVPLFLGSWWLAAKALGLPFEMPFQWTAWELFDASSYTRSWLGDLERMRGELAPPLVWASPYLVAAFGALTLARAASWLRTRRAAPVDVLILLGGLIFVAYFIKLAANFPKYHVGMLPYWSAALAWWLVDWLTHASRRERLIYVGALAAALVGFQAAVRDHWMWTTALVWEPTVLGPALVLFVLAGAAAVLPRWRAWAPRLTAALLVLYVGWALPTDAAQARADYSTSYYYGTRGQREAAALLDALGYDGPWIGPKEVAWYARNQLYIDADTFWWLVIAQRLRFDGQLLGYDVGVVVPWTMDPEVRTFFWEQLERRFDPIAEVEDYAAWVRRDRPRARQALAEAPHDRP